VKACDSWYGECKIKMLSEKSDGESNKRGKENQKEKEKRHKTRSLIYLLYFSNKNQGNTEVSISNWNRRS